MAAIAVLAVIAIHGPLAHWREARLERRAAESREQLSFPLSITTDTPRYYRYSLVRFRLALRNAAGQVIVTPNPPHVLVFRGKQFVESVGGLGQLVPRYDHANRVYVCRWPVPWNCPPGIYTAEVRYKMRDPEAWAWQTVEEQLKTKRKPAEKRKAQDKHKGQEKPQKPKEPEIVGDGNCVARTYFEVVAREPAPLPPGECVATWEEAVPTAASRIARPSGEMGGPEALFDWCDFIGADALWVRGAVTQAGATPLTMEQPFVPSNLQAIPALAAEAHRRGIKFGAWAAAYATLPEDPRTNGRKPRYSYSKDISRSTGKISDSSFVSLLDQHREDHLVGFLQAMQADPNVDQVGLDYMRTEPGYELTERFTREMPVKLPREWAAMDRTARWQYVAARAERQRGDEDRAFYDAWNWYRAHMGAEVISRLIGRSALQKPLWVFTLSWQHGVQHGQDPLMFTDAGVSMLCPMLYQIDVNRFPFIIKDWSTYVKAGQVNLLCGDQVDNFWHQRLGPAELVRRMLEAHDHIVPKQPTQGAFWHDISRAAVTGNLGPYSGVEWALAGGAAFSKVRESWSVYPLRAHVNAPNDAAAGQPVRLELELESRTDKAIHHIRIQPFSFGPLSLASGDVYEVAELKKGEKLTVPFDGQLGLPDPARNGQSTAAFRITWPDGEYGKQVRKDLPRVIIAVAYIHA